MTDRARTLAIVNAAWMAFVWVTRIRNAAQDDTISTSTRTGAYVLSAVCLTGAAALAVAAWRRLGGRWIEAVAVGHAAVWVVRGTQIALGDRSVGFKVVHVVLAVVSVGLAAGLVRSVRRPGGVGADRSPVAA